MNALDVYTKRNIYDYLAKPEEKYDKDYSNIDITYTEDPKTPADVNMNVSYRLIHQVIKKYNPGAINILGVGCGSARNSMYLAKQGYKVSGLDYSNEAIRLAHANASSEKLEIPLYQEDIFNPKHMDK